MKPAIKIENLSKQYRLGLVGTGTISHDLKRWWYIIRGKEDPYLKIGEINNRSTKGNSQYVWALKDVNLEIMPGEVLGIIGKNGAGKSTLLKILSKVTGPTTGTIDYKGRIGSLLEVGTGFHPELTGRENIYLNGAILGMRKKEIDHKFDEIVDFSGVERYIDTPTKRYSSGMTVRLGFAVAAFLEPEILVVDEVLAVGDAEFQKKAIGKMQDVSKNDGRTVLFVSHNMVAIQNLCSKAILIQNGKIGYCGGTNDTIRKYLTNNTSVDILKDLTLESRTFCVEKVIEMIWVEDINNEKVSNVHMNEPFSICFSYSIDSLIKNPTLGFGIEDESGRRITSINNEFLGLKVSYTKRGLVKFTINNPNLNAGRYYISPSVVVNNEWYDYLERCFYFDVEETDIYSTGKKLNRNQGFVFYNVDMNIYENESI